MSSVSTHHRFHLAMSYTTKRISEENEYRLTHRIKKTRKENLILPIVRACAANTADQLGRFRRRADLTASPPRRVRPWGPCGSDRQPDVDRRTGNGNLFCCTMLIKLNGLVVCGFKKRDKTFNLLLFPLFFINFHYLPILLIILLIVLYLN